MGNELKKLFDFQRFHQNKRLAEIISETESRYSLKEIEFDDLDMVNAAGDINIHRKNSLNKGCDNDE